MASASRTGRGALAGACLMVLALAACAAAEPPGVMAPAPVTDESRVATPAPWPKEGYRRAIAEGVEAYLSEDPVRASVRGDHRSDDKWPDLSDEGAHKTADVARAAAAPLRAFVSTVPADLTGADVDEVGTDHPALDAALLADRLDASALEAVELARPERDPSAVVELVGEGVTSLTTHDYAPAHVRYLALAGRLEAVPQLVRVARGRLRRASRAGYENLLIIGPGLARALRTELSKVESKALDGDEALNNRLRGAALAAAAALDAYVDDVKKSFPVKMLDATPIGGASWARLARLEEGVDDTPASVRSMGEAELERLTRELDDLIDASPRNPRRSAERTAPHGPKDRAAFLRLLGSSSLPEDRILAQYRYVNRGVEMWLKGHAFVSVPWDRAKVTIVQTPPQGRGTSFASMNEAGPLEPSATDARFEVNVPDPAMSAAQRESLRAFHTLGAIDLVSIHEALPGHYLQGLRLKEVRSTVRKILWAATLGEGWAHYCEQAVLDAGYTGDEPERTRGFYLRMALQRAARVVVDVGENDGTLSLDDGARLLEDRALLGAEAARMEARRAVVRPVNMFSYTYGKLAIGRLRRAVEAREGKAFDLVRFHDALLGVGAIPIGQVARVAFGLD